MPGTFTVPILAVNVYLPRFLTKAIPAFLSDQFIIYPIRTDRFLMGFSNRLGTVPIGSKTAATRTFRSLPTTIPHWKKTSLSDFLLLSGKQVTNFSSASLSSSTATSTGGYVVSGYGISESCLIHRKVVQRLPLPLSVREKLRRVMIYLVRSRPSSQSDNVCAYS
jgi:hypothetical protein